MKAEKLIAAESAVTLAGVIASDLLSQSDRTLPAPRRILGWFFFYGLLSLVASLGTGPARVAAAVGAVVALTTAILSTLGHDLTALLSAATGLFTTAPAVEAPAAVELPPWGTSTPAYNPIRSVSA